MGDRKRGTVARKFRSISADIMSRMIHIGPVIHCQLRGDTIGYLCELLQGYMLEKLTLALMLRINKVTVPECIYVDCEVQRNDIEFAFQGLSPFAPSRLQS